MFRLLLVLPFFYIFACAPSQFVKPLKAKEMTVSASLGGPVARVPGIGPIPIPMTSFGFGYGVNDRITVHSAWQTTSAIFGVAHFQHGATAYLWQNDNKNRAFTASINAHWMVDVFEKNFRIYPQFDFNYLHDFKPIFKSEKRQQWPSLYFGLGNFVELQALKAHGLNQEQRWKLMPQLGIQIPTKRFTFQFETKFIAPFTSNEDIVVNYVSYARNYGAMGLYFGMQYRFNTKNDEK